MEQKQQETSTSKYSLETVWTMSREYTESDLKALNTLLVNSLMNGPCGKLAGESGITTTLKVTRDETQEPYVLRWRNYFGSQEKDENALKNQADKTGF